MPDPSTLLTDYDVSAKSDELQGRNLKGSLAILKGLFNGDHLNASAGEHFSNKNFGRDSAISMLFLLDSQKNSQDAEVNQEVGFIIEQGIRSLVRWQGGKDPKLGDHWRKNAEEKGKIHHEASLVAIDKWGWADKWQDSDDVDSGLLVYFGSVDSTPLYVRLVCEYIKRLKSQNKNPHEAYEFLLSSVPNFRRGQTSIAHSLIEASEWIERQLASSDLGFIEYSRKPGQEQGLRNQVWKDSLTSYVHLDGELANNHAPIASIEVQALTYDALCDIADLFAADSILASSVKVDQQRINNWRQSAVSLQTELLKRFWVAEEHRFAQAIDRHPRTLEPRLIKTPSSNELHLLNSRVFDDLPAEAQKLYIESLVHQATSEEFLTDIGIRCRGRSYHNLIKFTDYHGSWAVWPWESHWIAIGLRRQGFAELADQVDTRIMNAFTISSEYAEFYLVNPSTGTPYYRFVELGLTVDADANREAVVATNIPDTPQTWSATASIDIQSIFSDTTKPKADAGWQRPLEKEILSYITPVHLLHQDENLEQLRERSAVAVVDLAGGKHADDHYYSIIDASQGLTPAYAN